MTPEQLTLMIWLLANAFATGAIVRAVKMWPTFPKEALPWLAIAIGYGLQLGLLVFRHVPLADAYIQAVWGLGAGAIAIGGHEALKPGLVWVFRRWPISMLVADPEASAAALLGKLQKAIEPPPSKSAQKLPEPAKPE